jgi:hypothetical protein
MLLLTYRKGKTKEDTDMEEKAVWYALMYFEGDTDWGDGTYDEAYALERLAEIQEDHPEAYIAVIAQTFDEDENLVNAECIKEIRDVY